mgnify:FL=1
MLRLVFCLLYLNYQKENEQGIDSLNIEECMNLIKSKEVAEGSMLPKTEACITFAKESDGYALITSLQKAKEALAGKTGTRIRKR